MTVALHQDKHPTAFQSKKLRTKLQNFSTYVRELHAITLAVHRWHHYLLGNKFIIETDKKSLKELMIQVAQTSDQLYYLSKLLGYDYDIVYRSGKDNKVADTLSRLDFPSQLFSMILSFPSFEIVKQIKIENNSSPELQAIHTTIIQQPAKRKNNDFTVKDGILYQKGKKFLGRDSPHKNILLTQHANRWPCKSSKNIQQIVGKFHLERD